MALYPTFKGDLEKFSYAVVFDSSGRPVPVSRFWNTQTVILVFLRHFGCIACRSHAQDVWSKREHLQKGGGRIIFIGNGAPTYIDSFREEFGLGNAPIFTDPTLKAFDLGGFRRGVMALVNSKSLSNAVALAKQGHRNGNPLDPGSGSNFQMGGVIVVHPGPRVTYHYVSEALGDIPAAEEIPSGPVAGNSSEAV